MTPGLHVVTDDAVLARPGSRALARSLMEAGGPALALHVRGPGTPGRDVWEVTSALAPPAREYAVQLTVNDRVDVALGTDVPAVHLGTRSLPVPDVRRLVGPEVRVGVSCHGRDAVIAAVAGGADYVFVGHVYETASHPRLAGRGVTWAAEMVSAAGACPVYGIGGIGPEELRELLDAGLAGAAVLRGVWDAPDPVGRLAEYIQVLDEGGTGSASVGSRRKGSETRIGER